MSTDQQYASPRGQRQQQPQAYHFSQQQPHQQPQQQSLGGVSGGAWNYTVPPQQRIGFHTAQQQQQGMVKASVGVAPASSSPGRYAGDMGQAGGGSPVGEAALPGSPVRSGSASGPGAGAASSTVVVQGKSRTTCNFCMLRKKRCDYEEINGQKQPCSLCKRKGQECVFEMKPQRSTRPAPKKNTLALKRARMGPSPATGLVGMEENVFVADFFDRLGFFPIASERTIQRAIMEVLFAPSIEASANAAKRRGIDPINVSPDGGAADPTRRLSCESDDSTHRVSDPAPDMDGMLGSALALHKRWQRKEGHTKAFNCILWCTIALGAMTSNISTRVVKSYVKLAEDAIDGLWKHDVETAKAYSVMAMVYAWLDKEKHFEKHLKAAQQLIEIVDDDDDAEEEIPLDLRDVVKELERVLALHYSDDMEVIERCCNSADGEPAQMSPLLMCDSGLFHMVRFYTDGVFKAFWRDVLKRDPILSETKKFSEKHSKECIDIEKVATTRPGLKNTGGALYIRAAMQFMRLPLKTDPMEALKSSVELTDVICKVPGMMRFGPVKHYVHCLVMGLARPAMAGMDRGAYEKLRSIYNNLDIRGPPIVGAEDMEIANLCKHPFCKGMAWFHQQKALRQMKDAAAKAQAEAAAAAASASAPTPSSPGAEGSSTSARANSLSEGQTPASPTAGGTAVGDAPAAEREGSIGDSGAAVRSGIPFGGSSSPQVTGAGSAGDTGGGAGAFSNPPFSQPQHQPQQAVFRGDGTAAAPYEGMRLDGGRGDGTGTGGGATTSLPQFALKRERLDAFPQAGAPQSSGGGVEAMSATTSSSSPYASGVAWHDQMQQQQRQQRQDRGGVSASRLPAAKRTALHPGGGPSVSSFLAQPQHQQAARKQQQQQHQQQHVPLHTPHQPAPQWGGGGAGEAGIRSPRRSASPSSRATAAATAAAAATEAAAAAEAAAIADRRMDIPEDVMAFAQGQLRQDSSLERTANVQGLHDLLLQNDADDCRAEMPEMYEGESDTELFASFVPDSSSGGGDDEEDESLRSLAAHLLR